MQTLAVNNQLPSDKSEAMLVSGLPFGLATDLCHAGKPTGQGAQTALSTAPVR